METAFADGTLDEPFGGSARDDFSCPERELQDDQARDLQSQARDFWWLGRPVQRLPMASAGAAGDVIVFDVFSLGAAGRPVFRTLIGGGYVQDATPIVGVLLDDAAVDDDAPVAAAGGWLPASVTGLSSADIGPITMDTTTGRLRKATAGEVTTGYCDARGNCLLLRLIATS